MAPRPDICPVLGAIAMCPSEVGRSSVTERPTAWPNSARNLAITPRIELIATPAEYGGCGLDANILYIPRDPITIVGRVARAWRCLGLSGLPVDRKVKPNDV